MSRVVQPKPLIEPAEIYIRTSVNLPDDVPHTSQMYGTSGAEYGIIWDMDGVLVDTAEQHFQAWRRLWNEVGVPFSYESFQKTFGWCNEEIIPYILGHPVSLDELAYLSARKESYYRDCVRNLKPAPGALSLLADLAAAGCRQAIGSSAPRANVELILELLRLAPYFSAVVTNNDVQRGKPDPQVFQVAAERLGLPPERCLVLEDAPAGVAAAKAIGMRAIGVTTTHPAISLSQADKVVGSLTELSAADVLALFAKAT